MRQIFGWAFDLWRNVWELAAIVANGLLEAIDDALDAWGDADE